jgi:hypothetical protein
MTAASSNSPSKTQYTLKLPLPRFNNNASSSTVKSPKTRKSAVNPTPQANPLTSVNSKSPTLRNSSFTQITTNLSIKNQMINSKNPSESSKAKANRKINSNPIPQSFIPKPLSLIL